MKYKINAHEFEVVVIRKNNKNTYIRVKDLNTILVTTNYMTTNKTILKLLDNNHEFINNALERLNKSVEKQDKFYYLGKEYNVIFSKVFHNLELDNTHIYCENEKQLSKWLKNETEKIFTNRLDYWYNVFDDDIPYPKLKLRNMKTRWGVCNRRNNTVTLNTKLIEYDYIAIDYVIVHELSHFVHFNHSNAFWCTVNKYYPNYKIAKRILKE